MSNETKTCRLFHKWSRWTRPVDTFNSSSQKQFRECVGCGKVQQRSVNYTFASEKSIRKSLDEVNPTGEL